MFKNQLQELAQRSCFNFPSYACIREGPDHAPRFKATVNFNGEVFESPTFCSTLRQAEHAAAEVALDLLSNKGPSKALAARVLDETGVYKNLLQETVHKAGLKLPVYTTVQSGSGHVPLFSCTVELAGMSFQGESAKTKKQAQKNAAIGAWAALKQLSRSGSCASSSSSSPLLESGVNDEQEQIIVARYLVTLRPPELNKSAQRDQQCEQWRSGQVRRDLIPPFGDGSMQYQSWTYPHFSPEVDLYQNWPQERASQQQSRLLALPSSPMSPSTPQFFPFIRSIFQPGNGQYFLSTEQEPVPFVPGMGSFLYFTNSSIPLPIRSISQVTIQEMEENPQREENWLHSDANSHCWPINFPSNASVFSPIEVPNPPNSLTSHSDWRIPDMLPEKAEYTGNSNQLEAKQTEHRNWNSPRCTDTRFRPRATSADDTKFRLQNPQSLDYLHHNNRPCMVNSTGLARGYRPPSSAAPVTVRNANAAVTGSLRPENSQPSTRTSVSGYSTRPWPGGIRNAGCMPSANFMAPAVHIRSVVPVCSAPPAKKVASPSQPGLFSGAENSRTKKPEGDISAASSELNQLQI